MFMCKTPMLCALPIIKKVFVFAFCLSLLIVLTVVNYT